jgi:hypothetical protein
MWVENRSFEVNEAFKETVKALLTLLIECLVEHSKIRGGSSV